MLGTHQRSALAPSVSALLLTVAALACGPALSSCSAPAEIDLPRYEVVASVSEMVDPAVGATLRLGGATLEVPPGALAEPAELFLVETSLPVANGPDAELASAGQIPLSSSGFLVATDREVELASAIYLDLPIDEARIPAGASLSDVNVSAYLAGYLHPQGRAVSVEGGTARAPITVPRLPLGAAEGGPPRGEGVGFLTGFFALSVSPTVVVGAAGSVVLGAFLQPVMATLEDVPYYQELSTENFTVHYRDGVTEAQAMQLASELERAHAYYVGELGFSLPNVGSAFTRYNVYVADLSTWREYVPSTSRAPDGGTWAGSIVWGGSSYLNAASSQDARISTAMHEYFHAVQWGATRRVAPNSAAKLLDPEGQWLIEGSATAMAGRMIAGGGSAPSRDLTQNGTIHRATSIFDPTGHDPAPDVAQDFFVFLEQREAGAAFYREMFEQVSDDLPGGGIEPSVVAVDEVLRARSDGASGLAAAWTEFMRDFLWDRPDEYGGVAPPPPSMAVAGDGTPRTSGDTTLPPLSYEAYEFALQRFQAGTPLEEQRGDLQLDVTVRGGSVGQVDVQVGVVGTPPQRVELTASGEPATVVIRGARSSEIARVWVTAANPLLANDDRVTVSVTATMVAAPLPPYPTTPPEVPSCAPSLTLPEIPNPDMPEEPLEPSGVWTLVTGEENDPALVTDARGDSLSHFRQVCSYASPTGAEPNLRFRRVWQPYDVSEYETTGSTIPTTLEGPSACGGDPGRSGVAVSATRQVAVETASPIGWGFGWVPPCFDCAFEDAFNAALIAQVTQLEASAVVCP